MAGHRTVRPIERWRLPPRDWAHPNDVEHLDNGVVMASIRNHLVADSQSNRIVEYERTDDDGWRRTWLWRNADMQWPRDADRLPSGNTLITDTHADRMIEVNRSGAIVWSARFPGPYEAERLDTGPESAGGPSATVVDMDPRNVGSGTLNGVLYGFLSLIPPIVLHATMFALSNWVSPLAAAGTLLVVTVLVL